MGVQRLLREFSILGRACEQRGSFDSRDPIKRYLSQAEDILEEYCALWAPGYAGPYLSLKTPVVYFEKLYRITRAVYAPDVPIVSIPLTEYNNPDQWQALAHEMGHHIYWNALDSLNVVERLHQEMYKAVAKGVSGQDTAHLWGSWLEEVFADICGALFVGLDYVITSQNLMADRVRKLEDLTKDDFGHPCPYLRPFIATQTLREIAVIFGNDSLESSLDEMDEIWESFVGGIDDPQHARTGIPMLKLVGDIESIVQIILQKQFWPEEKNLLDLIHIDDRQFVAEERVKVSKQRLSSSKFVPLKAPMEIAGLLYEPGIDDIPAAMQEIYHYLKARIEPLDRGSHDPLTYWNMLLELSLSETHHHGDNVHLYPAWHWYYPFSHLHSGDTNQVIMC